MAIGFIGFGEAASALAQAIREAEPSTVLVACIRTRGLRSRTHYDDAERLGVELSERPGILSRSDLILSVVTPASALSVAETVAPHLHDGQRFVDLNSTSPDVKVEIESELSRFGVEVVDGTLTGGGVALDGRETPIDLSGPRAPEVAEILLSFQLRASVLGDRVGMVAAVKMARGVLIKTMDAAAVEALLLANSYGVTEHVLDSWERTFSRFSIRDFIDMLVRTHLVHAARRAEEARMIAESVNATQIEAKMSRATSEFFARTASTGIADFVGERVPKTFAAGLEELGRRLRERGVK